MKKFLKAILLSSLFVVASAVSAFAATGNVVVSFTDAEGEPLTQLTVGETATMNINLTLDDDSIIIASAEMYYELSNLSLTPGTGDWVTDDGMFTFYDGSASNTTKEVNWTATVTPEAAGTATMSIIQDETSYVMNDTSLITVYDFNVTGNTITVVANELPLPSVSVEGKQEAYTDGSGKFTQGFLATTTVSAATKPINAIIFNLTRTAPEAGTDTITATLPTKVTNGEVKAAVNIINVLSGVVITATGTAVAAAN